MKLNEFTEHCEVAFRHVSQEFGLTLHKSESLDGEMRVYFHNSRSGIIIDVSMREYFITVFVCRLVDGDFDMPCGEMRPDTKLNCFDLNYVAQLRDPQKVVKGPQSGKVYTNLFLINMLHEYAETVALIAADILRGDFAVFEDLDALVKNVARRVAIEKWGKRARDYGW